MHDHVHDRQSTFAPKCGTLAPVSNALPVGDHFANLRQQYLSTSLSTSNQWCKPPSQSKLLILSPGNLPSKQQLIGQKVNRRRSNHNNPWRRKMSSMNLTQISRGRTIPPVNLLFTDNLYWNSFIKEWHYSPTNIGKEWGWYCSFESTTVLVMLARKWGDIYVSKQKVRTVLF